MERIEWLSQRLTLLFHGSSQEIRDDSYACRASPASNLLSLSPIVEPLHRVFT
jgi:hypothetical protein